MSRRSGELAALLGALVAVLGCGKRQIDQPADAGAPPADAGAPPADANADAGAPPADAAVDSLDASGPYADGGRDGASFCGDAGAVVRNPAASSSIPPFCGGQVDVAGTSPLGPFVADAVLTSVGAYDCYGDISINLYTGPVTAPAQIPVGLALSFSLKYDSTLRTWLGTHVVTGGLRRTDGSPSIPVPITVNVTAADGPYSSDGNQAPSPQPPPGLYHLTIDADTGCDHITGTITAAYCDWSACI